MCKNDASGAEIDCVWVAENAIPTHLSLGFSYGNQVRMGYALPRWIQGKTTPLILLIDDYSRAVLPVLQAINEVVDRQEYLSWSLPKGSTVLLTANPDNGEYIVNATDGAMDSRKLKLFMKFDVDAWAVWAEKYGVDSRAINFILKFPEVVEGVGDTLDSKGNRILKSNIRQWTKFFDAISEIEDFSKDLQLVTCIGSGSIPQEYLFVFLEFIRNGLDKLMSPKELLTGSKTKVMDHLKDVINPSTGRRQDIAAITAKRLLNYAVVNSKDFTPAMVDMYGDILEEDFLSKDLVILTARKLSAIKKFEKLAVRNGILKLLAAC